MVNPMQQLTFTCTALILVSGCIGLEPTSITQLEPQGDPFQAALHAEYAELAVKESALYDFGDATRFAEKAQQAAAGHDVAPEAPENWQIDPIARGELASARQQMVTLLQSTSARVEAPAQAAAAQAAYDCWLEEQQEGQLEDIEICRERFRISVADVQTAIRADIAPAAGPEWSERASEEYEIFFPLNGTRLSAEAELVVRRLAEAARDRRASRISVAGHADRSGPRAYNERLSRQRAEAVAAGLARFGVPPSMINTAALGEEQPAVETVDGAAHQMNRRVVVRLL